MAEERPRTKDVRWRTLHWVLGWRGDIVLSHSGLFKYGCLLPIHNKALKHKQKHPESLKSFIICLLSNPPICDWAISVGVYC